jgi:hypothetical protein
MPEDEEHEPVKDDQGSEEEADSGTLPGHDDPHPATDESPRRH